MMKLHSPGTCGRNGLTLAVLLVSIAAPAAWGQAQGVPKDTELPLYFEANVGQAEDGVAFLGRGDGLHIALMPSQATLRLRTPKGLWAQVALEWAGADPRASLRGEDRRSGESRYFMGNDPSRWVKAAPHYARVRYHELYPGVDLVFYGQRRQFEFDFIVRPGADPSAIRLRLRGLEGLSLAPDGRLRLRTPAGDLWQPRPFCYQMRGGSRVAVRGEYKLLGPEEVGFALGDYDRNAELVIDPLLVWLTYYGGTGLDAATAIALDSQGNVVAAGYTESPNLAAAGTGSVQAPVAEMPRHGFIVKLSGDGRNVLWATYFGGNRNDEIHALALDGAGNVYVAGRTDSTNLPVSANAFQRTMRSTRLWGEGFVAKLSAAGQLVYATYLGGNEFDQVLGLAVDGAGKAYVTGETFSDDFPTTAGVLRGTPCAGFNTDAFVSKFNADGSALEYSTLICGSLADRALAIAVDSAGNAYVAGETTSADFPVTSGAVQGAPRGVYEDAFVVKLNPAGSQLLYSTYLGGSFPDAARAIAVDSSGAIYVGGSTRSTDFPATAGSLQNANRDGGVHEDGFVVKFNPGSAALAFATYLGGSAADRVTAIKVDAAGAVYVAGFTASTNFPRSGGKCEPGPSGRFDAFAGKLAPNGARFEWMMVLGGRADDYAHAVAFSATGETYVAGRSDSVNLPSTPGAFRTAYANGYRGAGDAFVARISGSGALSTPCIAAGGILNNASYVPGPLAPGEIVAIFGEGIGPDVLATGVVESGFLTKSLGGVRVLFDDIPAPMVFAWSSQLSAIVPFAVAGKSETRVRVEFDGIRSNEVVLPVAAAAPGIFSFSASGEGLAAIINQDWTINTPANPAPAGSVIVLFATGAGQTSPAGEDGKVNPLVLPLPTPANKVRVFIAGSEAEILYAGNAPGLVHGALQVNARIPANTPAGAFIPLVLEVGGVSSQRNLYVSVRR